MLIGRYVSELLDLLQLGKPLPHCPNSVRLPREFQLPRTKAFLKVGDIKSFEVSAEALVDLLLAAPQLAGSKSRGRATESARLDEALAPDLSGHAMLIGAAQDIMVGASRPSPSCKPAIGSQRMWCCS